MNANRLRQPRRLSTQGGFTLIEILVALGVFSVLLAIIMVPLNMGVNMTRIGSARTDTQQAAQAMMNRIVTDLRGATYVFPNEPIRLVTDKFPYTNNKLNPTDQLGLPYYRAPLGNENVCGTADIPFSNTSRIDFLKPTLAGLDPHSITTFYTARANVRRPWSENADSPSPETYDADLNPIVMYAAQMPFERFNAATNDAAGDYLVGGNRNVIVGPDRLDPSKCGTLAADINQGARWLMHNGAGEPFLALQADSAATPSNPALQDDLAGATPTDPASNTRITPLGIGLYAPDAYKPADATNLTNNQRGFTPATSFICEDTNSNGIIDRVTVTLVMGKYDGAGVENRAQSVRLTQVVDLPNTESRFAN